MPHRLALVHAPRRLVRLRMHHPPLLVRVPHRLVAAHALRRLVPVRMQHPPTLVQVPRRLARVAKDADMTRRMKNQNGIRLTTKLWVRELSGARPKPTHAAATLSPVEDRRSTQPQGNP